MTVIKSSLPVVIARPDKTDEGVWLVEYYPDRKMGPESSLRFSSCDPELLQFDLEEIYHVPVVIDYSGGRHD